MRFDLSIDKAALDREVDKTLTRILLAGTRAVQTQTRKLEKDLEGITRVAVRGRLYRAWKSEVYPTRPVAAYAPAGEVFVNGRARSKGAMAYFTTPGVNRKANGEWLAIPTDSAGVLGRDRLLTPGEWERRTGIRLRFVYRPNRAALLVMDNAVTARDGRGAARSLTKKRETLDRRSGVSRYAQTIPIFVLIPMQRHANRFSVEPLVRRAEAALVSDYRRRLERETA